MKLALALLLNAGLLALLLPWLARQWRWAGPGWWRIVFVAGLALRVGVGVGRSWSPQLDAGFMTSISQMVTAQIQHDPSAAWNILTKAVTVLRIQNGNLSYHAVYQNMSNTWILIKILAVLNLFTLQVSWLNGVYLSIFAFIGSWQLVRTLACVFPATPAGAGVVAFLLWPSVWFWTTGISKEAVLLGSGAWLTAKVVAAIYQEDAAATVRWRAGWWLGTAALALLHFQMRYFFAVPLLGVLAGVALGEALQRISHNHSRWVAAGALAAVLGAGAGVAPHLSVAFSVNKFTNQVARVYSFEAEHSAGRPHVEYSDLRPTGASIAAHAPAAALNALVRPWLGESRQPLYVAAGLENAALLVLLALAAAAAVRRRAGHLPFALGLGLAVCCGALAVLVGLTTANFGSLNRYRSELLPFLLLLLLQNDFAAAGMRFIGMAPGRNSAPADLGKSPVRPAA